MVGDLDLWENRYLCRVYWLAEQGLAPKRVFLVIIPLIIFIISSYCLLIIRRNKPMGKHKKNTLDVLAVSRIFVRTLSGNMAGGALLANTF